MQKDSFSGVRLIPDHGGTNEVVRVYWLSRHAPTEEQLLAWFLIHSKGIKTVEVITVSIYFQSPEEIAHLISNKYRDGFCYLIAPFEIMNEVVKIGCQFGRVDMRKSDNDSSWHLLDVVHFNTEDPGYRRPGKSAETVVLHRSRLEEYNNRRLVHN